MVLKSTAARFGGLMTGALMLCMGMPANATIIVENLPEFSFDGGPTFPTAAQDMGTFAFMLPVGETIISAVLNGSFGNTANSSSAAHRVFADGSLVATCPGAGDPCFNFGIDPWEFNFVSFADLLDGSLVMTGVQDAENRIRAGAMTLTIETEIEVIDTDPPSQGVSEPGTLAIMGLGLVGLGLARRRKAA